MKTFSPFTACLPFAILSACLSGCAVSPLTQVQGDRDFETYVIPNTIQYRIEKTREMLTSKEISVLVDQHALSESKLVTANQIPMIRENLRTDITTRLLSIPFFHIQPVNPLTEKMTAQEYKAFIDKKIRNKPTATDPLGKDNLPDYTVIASITYISSTTGNRQDHPIQTTSTLEGPGDQTVTSSFQEADTDQESPSNFTAPDSIVVKMAMEFYDCKNQKPFFSRVIHRKVSDIADQSIQDSIIQGLSDCAKEYTEFIANKLGNWKRGRVLKTVGNGRFARISMGSDSGLDQGSMIAFYEFENANIEDFSDNPSSSDIDLELPVEAIAFGQVVNSVPIEKSAAWVQIRDWKKVSVKQGQLVGHIVYDD